VKLHREVVARRVRQYIEQVRQAYQELEISEIAEKLGYGDSEVLDRLIEGERYHSWVELEEFCAKTGISMTWLKHGRGNLFRVGGDFIDAGLEVFGALEGDWKLYVVKSRCDEGKVCAVLKRGELVWEAFASRVRIKLAVNAYERYALVAFHDFIARLPKGVRARLWGYELDGEEFDGVVTGAVFPKRVISDTAYGGWVDWFMELGPHDEAMSKEMERWGAGFLAAQGQIRGVVMSRRSSEKGKKKIGR